MSNELICETEFIYAHTGGDEEGSLDPHDKFMNNIDSEHKAYLLGWIASNGHVRKVGITLSIHNRDLEIFEKLRLFICSVGIHPHQVVIKEKDDIIYISISSPHLSQDVCNHLGIQYGKKDRKLTFPNLIDNLKMDFVRGFLDGDGCISSRKSGYPFCSIASNSELMLFSIQEFSEQPSCINRDTIEWNGINCVDFLAKLYEEATIYMESNHNLFLSLANCTAMRLNQVPHRLPVFRWCRTIQDAPKPQKTRFSDSGYDLHIIKQTKVKGNVYFYDTGISIQPENGYYFDLVGRSSISKSGWTLANNIGIIDSSYTGSIIVALVRINPDAPEIELPCRLVQLIPRQLILMEDEEVTSLISTDRGEGGFGST
jgi:deoxyuridine 5'-triphosphate nucleotidohydrolase